MTFDEIFKTSLVFVHFLASAVALATILRADFLILTHFTSKLSSKACDRIHAAKSVVSGALAVLWVTGVVICIHGGSWIGGDRDGNPNVTHEVTWETLNRQRRLVLKKYKNVLVD